MKIPMIFYEPVSKEIEIEFPFCYTSTYSDDRYWEEVYVLILESGIQITLSNDSEGMVIWKREKIDFSMDLPEELFEIKGESGDKYTIISYEEFLEYFNSKFIRL